MEKMELLHALQDQFDESVEIRLTQVLCDLRQAVHVDAAASGATQSRISAELSTAVFMVCVVTAATSAAMTMVGAATSAAAAMQAVVQVGAVIAITRSTTSSANDVKHSYGVVKTDSESSAVGAATTATSAAVTIVGMFTSDAAAAAVQAVARVEAVIATSPVSSAADTESSTCGP